MAAREHKISDWKKEQAMKLRIEDNMTYREIAKEMGVSAAYVGQLLKEAVVKKNFHRWKYDSVPYPVLVEWMNDHQMSKMELALRLGYSPNGSSQYIIYRRMRNGQLDKNEIDKLLQITGLDYETLFRRRT